jgi:hypothetical protein
VQQFLEKRFLIPTECECGFNSFAKRHLDDTSII